MTEAAAARRRPWRNWLAIALLAILAGLVIYRVGAPDRGQGPVGPARSLPRDAALGEPPPPVHLDALSTARAGPRDASRNPFKFQPAAAPAPVRPVPVAPPPVNPGAGAAGAAGGGSAAAPPPPIPLKFIGTIDAPGVGTIAALSDGKFVYHGREGDVIEGRYRIVKIGVESIVMEHVDGGGRQTIRLAG
jgi:hypothetical protein